MKIKKLNNEVLDAISDVKFLTKIYFYIYIYIAIIILIVSSTPFIFVDWVMSKIKNGVKKLFTK